MNNLLIFMLTTLVFITSCSKKYLDRKEYESWLFDPENSMIQTAKIGDYSLELMYLPTEYQYIKGYNDKHQNYKKIIKEYKNKTVFTLRMSHNKYKGNFILNKTKNESEFAVLKKYMEFDFKNDILLVSGVDTSDCVIYHSERSYGLTPYVNSTLIFNSPPTNTDLQLILDDKKLGFGKVKFSYLKNDLTNLPKLKQ